MNDQLRPLSARIRIELVDLVRVLHRVEEGWQRAQRAADDYYLVPCVVQEDDYFLKTIYASRKATRDYLRKDNG